MNGPVLLSGSLPSGEQFASSIDLDVIVLRVGDRTCIAAPNWMTAEQAGRVSAAIGAAAGPSPIPADRNETP